MDALFKKIIEKTELKNWTLFLFIFAICYAIGLRFLTGAWFHIPDADDKFNNTTLFLLEVFLSSLTITRILVAIKFLEALNRTPIIADFINAVVVERQLVIGNYKYLIKVPLVTGANNVCTLGWILKYQNGIPVREAWVLIYNETIVDNEYPNYKICKEVVAAKTSNDCLEKEFAITGFCTFKLNPILYRHFDKGKYGFWILKRPFCLEHIILILFLAVAIDLYLVYIYYFPFFPFYVLN